MEHTNYGLGTGQCFVLPAILPGIAKLLLHVSVSECHKHSLGESFLNCYFILYRYVICKLHIYVISVCYIERDRHIYSYISIYREGRVLLLYFCILTVLPEQLLRMLGTTMTPIMKTDVKGTL